MKVIKIVLLFHLPTEDYTFDLIQCRDQLKGDYEDNRGGIGFLPGMPKEFPLEEFFVELSLVHEERRPTNVIQKNLIRYTDLLTLESRTGKRLRHVLVRGEAGTGKTTLIDRLAHQWAIMSDEDLTQNPLSEFDLVFALNIRQIKSGMDLVDCIQNQLLTDMHKEAIQNMIVAHASRCLYLLDGYDELKVHQNVLGSKLLHRSFVIVTTRPDKVDQFCQDYNGFVHVKLSGFSDASKETFVRRYFASSANDQSKKDASDKVDRFLQKVQQSYLKSLSCFPLLLAMMCSIFYTTGELQMRMTALYAQVARVFATQYHAKVSKAKCLSNSQICDVDGIFLSLGSVALKGLLIDDKKLIFDRSDFDTESDLKMIEFWIALSCGVVSAFVALEIGYMVDSLCLGFLLMIVLFLLGFNSTRFIVISTDSIINIGEQRGILTKVYYNDKLLPATTQYSFLHRTFQEFSAAMYWSNLAASDPERFEYFLSQINTENVQGMQYLLRFCCGLSYEAARRIIHHVITKCDVDWRLPVTLLFEAETDSMIHPSLHDSLCSLKSLEIGSRETMTPELWSILLHYSHHCGDQKQGQTWLWHIEKLTIVVDDCSRECVQFLSSFTKIGSSIRSFEFQITLFDTTIVAIDFKILTKFLLSQLDLRHLVLVDNRLGSKPEWEGLLMYLLTNSVDTSPYLGHLIPNLESLSLVGLSNVPNDCWIMLLDTFTSAGELLQGRRSSSELVESADNKCDDTQSLPIHHFDISGSLTFQYLESDDLLLHRLRTALSFMSSLVYLGLRGVYLRASSLHVLAPAVSRMAMLETLSIDGALMHDNFRTNKFQNAGKDLCQILQNLRNLTSLNFAGTGLEDGISLLPLSILSELTLLDLSGNRLRSQSWGHLSDALKYLPKLTELYLKNTSISEQGITALSAAFRHIPLLKHFSITLSTNGSFAALADGFRYIQKLKYLHVLPESYSIKCEAIEALFRNLVYLPQLDELYLDYDHQNINYSPLVQICIQEVGKLYSAEYMYEYRFNRSDILRIVKIAQRFDDDAE